MDDGTASTHSVYYSGGKSLGGRHIWHQDRTAEEDSLAEFRRALEDREDGGAGLWATVTALLRATPDGPRPEPPPLPPPVPPNSNAVVYYLRFGDRIKIGTSTNLRARLEAIPHDEVLATEAGSYEVEHHRHAQFAHLRIKGEWFRAEPDLLDFIATIA